MRAIFLVLWFGRWVVLGCCICFSILGIGLNTKSKMQLWTLYKVFSMIRGAGFNLWNDEKLCCSCREIVSLVLGDVLLGL
jgi:hypothetical protein